MFTAREFEDAVRDEIALSIKDRPVPRAPWEPEVDSLVMIRVVLRIEEEFAINLPDDVMPSGGFRSVDHCVETMLNACRDLWNVSQPQSAKV